MLSITLCMIVKNEESNLSALFKNIEGVFDEIVIVDTGSKDKTVEIAKEFGAKVLHYDWDNNFAKAKNFAFKNAESDWIFSLDADERLSPKLKQKIPELIQTQEKLVYEFQMKDYLLKWAVLTDIKKRMFPKGEAEYQGEIHEELIHDCKVETIKCGTIVHVQGLEHWLAKPERILPRIALDIERSKKEYDNLSYLFYAFLKFWKHFLGRLFLKQGFRDGIDGIKFSLMKGIYFGLKELFIGLKPKNISRFKNTSSINFADYED